MNIFSYIDKFGCYTLDEVPFNEVDNVIFSALSYVSFFGIVSPNRFNKKTIKEVGDKYFRLYPYKKKYIWAVKQAVRVLKTIKDTKRYGNLYLYNYVYEAGSEQQFSALTIELNSKLVYVSFEGTDHLVSGWKEDFMMTYTFPVKSQRKAIDYVNKNFFFRSTNIILGGHSKGGNLALVAGMYANFLVKDKIIKIYNNDGPGLLREQFESKYYDSIKNKLVHIVPNYAIVGLLLLHDDDYLVVRASKRGPMAHDFCTWIVKEDMFMKAELETLYKNLSEELISWLNKYSREERKRFVLEMFDIFDRSNIDSFMDFIDNKKLIFDLIDESKSLNEEDILMFKDLLSTLFNCFKDAKIDEIKNLIYNKIYN